MTWKTRLLLRESAFTAVAFTAAGYFYYLIAFWGMQDQLVDGPWQTYVTSRTVFVKLLVGGTLFGGMIGVINRLTETNNLRRKPIGQIVLIRTALYLASYFVVFGLIAVVFATLILPWEELISMFQAVTPRFLGSFVIYMFLVIGAINFALEVERLIGPGNLWLLFTGRYRRPLEESRAFLFLDLKGSTTIAEDLGHQRYSEFLQECYRDLTPTVMRYEASIYQYVGDEVVLSWPYPNRSGTSVAGVQTYFAFKRSLSDKREAYIKRFGVAPEFRGGIDAGPVTVIEVGDIKREIVYHGDVLNTAARLLELCKTKNGEVVVSGVIGDAVKQDANFQVGWQGEVDLRGKREPIEAFSIHEMTRS